MVECFSFAIYNTYKHTENKTKKKASESLLLRIISNDYWNIDVIWGYTQFYSCIQFNYQIYWVITKVFAVVCSWFANNLSIKLYSIESMVYLYFIYRNMKNILRDKFRFFDLYFHFIQSIFPYVFYVKRKVKINKLYILAGIYHGI